MTDYECKIAAAVADEFAAKWLKRPSLPSAWRDPCSEGFRTTALFRSAGH